VRRKQRIAIGIDVPGVHGVAAAHACAAIDRAAQAWRVPLDLQLPLIEEARRGHDQLQSKRLLIESQWVSKPLAFAVKLRPRRLNN
jgi:hypothetical protein